MCPIIFLFQPPQLFWTFLFMMMWPHCAETHFNHEDLTWRIATAARANESSDSEHQGQPYFTSWNSLSQIHSDLCNWISYVWNHNTWYSTWPPLCSQCLHQRYKSPNLSASFQKSSIVLSHNEMLFLRKHFLGNYLWNTKRLASHWRCWNKSWFSWFLQQAESPLLRTELPLVSSNVFFFNLTLCVTWLGSLQLITLSWIFYLFISLIKYWEFYYFISVAFCNHGARKYFFFLLFSYQTYPKQYLIK